MPDLDKATLRKELLRWYGAAKRDLPWRRTKDPYAILVSELMLQQTQVKTALPYYARFLERFPDAAALAAAPQQEVLAAWAGLGYYRRARYLHAAAKLIAGAAGSGGDAPAGFPRTLEGIRALPGVGAYTAAAVASIAFGLPAAVVDGNVLRVLSRVLALEEDPTQGAGAARIRETAQALLDPRRPGDFNQALMELGAGPCSPLHPRCGECPLRAHCAAHLAGKAGDFPRLPARAATRSVVKAVLLLTAGKGKAARILARARDGASNGKKGAGARILSRERDGAVPGEMEAGAATGRLAGFWGFPEAALPAADWTLAESQAGSLARKFGGPGAVSLGRLPSLRHRITVHDIRLFPFHYQSASARPQRGGWRWVNVARLEKLPLASADRKLLGALESSLGSPPEKGGQLGLKF